MRFARLVNIFLSVIVDKERLSTYFLSLIIEGKGGENMANEKELFINERNNLLKQLINLSEQELYLSKKLAEDITNQDISKEITDIVNEKSVLYAKNTELINKINS